MSLESLARAHQEWNRPDENGKTIQPPITIEEAASFERYSVYPDVEVDFGNLTHNVDSAESRKRITAKMVFIACTGVRRPSIPNYNPDVVADLFLAARKKAAEKH